MTSGEAQRLIRLKVNIQKILDELQALKVEKEELDIETTHTRTLGSIVHDLYTGVERAFQKIALELDGGLPKGERWHKDLLDHMALELKGIRPPVIDASLRDKLDEYLRFRHIFRSVYGFQLKRRVSSSWYKPLTAFSPISGML